jgi:hypothetical protein
MEPNSRKRKADDKECGNSSSASVEFIMVCKKKKNQARAVPKQEGSPPTPMTIFTPSRPPATRKLGQANPERPRMSTPVMTPRLERLKKTEGPKIGTGGISLDEAIREIHLVVSNCEDRVRDLQEKNEEWKETVATRTQESIDSYEAQVARVEKEIQVEDVHGLAENMDDMKKQYHDELVMRLEGVSQKMEGIKKDCQDEIDIRLRGFANHMMEFFSQNSSPVTQSDTSVFDGTDGMRGDPFTEAPTIKSSESKPIGSAKKRASKIVSNSALGLSGDSFSKDACLNNRGYQQLMRNFSFRNISQLEALAKTDRRENLRDCNIFCDISYPTSWIDYVVRIGGCSSLIVDETPGVIYEHHPILERADLSQLRILKLQLSAACVSTKTEFKEWKNQFSPPKYVYELGQLFVRRRFHKGSKKTEVYSTVYNLVMDVAKPEKPVWLVVRPGCTPSQLTIKRHKDSTLPFNGMDNCGMARLVDKIGDLSFTRADFDRSSYSAFVDAEQLVRATGCKVELDIKCKAADITDMVDAILRR